MDRKKKSQNGYPKNAKKGKKVETQIILEDANVIEQEKSKAKQNKKANKGKVQNKNLNTMKIVLVSIIAIAIIGYCIYGIYNLIKQPTDKFTVEEGSVSEEEEAVGYLIRDEKMVQGENYKNGILPIKAEGERAANGESIFRYYSNNEEELTKKIEELDAKIDEALSKETETFSSDIKVLDKQISEKINSIYQCNDMQKIKEYKKDIENYVTKKAKIAGELSPAGSYTKELIKERSDYENKLNSSTEYVKAPMGGIVSYRIDGLEDVLTPTDFSTITKETLEKLNMKTGQIIPTSTESGKIINNFICYMACISNSENAKEIEVGKKIKLRLSNGDEIDAKLEYKSQEEDSYVLIFSFNDDIQELTSYRKTSVDIIWWSYSGLKVPNSAICYDGEKAYVVRNRAGYLDKILVKVDKKNENYSIVENYSTEELKELGYSTKEIINRKSISLYDEIVLNPDLTKVQ